MSIEAFGEQFPLIIDKCMFSVDDEEKVSSHERAAACETHALVASFLGQADYRNRAEASQCLHANTLRSSE